MEQRRFQCDIRASKSGKTIVGVIPYNSPSEDLGGFTEYLLPGCFNKALRNGKKKFALWNHDDSKPLANTEAGTLILIDSLEALHVTIKPSDTTWGRDAIEAAKRGDINGFSFGFLVTREGEKWTDGNKREIIEVEELFEISPVTFPAYPATTISVRGKNTMQDDNFVQMTPGSKAQYKSPVDEAKEQFLDQLPEKSSRELRGMIDNVLVQPAGSPIKAEIGTPQNRNHHEFRSFMAGETRALTVGTDSEGGHTVPEDLEAAIKAELRARNAVRQVAQITRTGTEALDVIVNRGGTAASFVTETASRPETSGPSFEKVSIPVYDCYSNIFVTQQLIDDSAADIENFVREEIGGKHAAVEEDKFINGTGTTEPTGIMNYTKTTDGDDTRTFQHIQHAVAASATAITTDELIDLVYMLASQYRTGAAFLVNSQTIMAIRKLKDGDGQYLWQPGLTGGEPNRLLGYPIFTCEQMPSMAAGNTPIAFANWRLAYRIVDHARGTLVLRDPYSNKPYVSFYASRRVGGSLVEDKAIKMLTMAAS